MFIVLYNNFLCSNLLCFWQFNNAINLFLISWPQAFLTLHIEEETELEPVKTPHTYPLCQNTLQAASYFIQGLKSEQETIILPVYI